MYGQRPRHEHELRRHAVRLQVSELVSQHDKMLSSDPKKKYGGWR
jgi:hypothetical protein